MSGSTALATPEGISRVQDALVEAGLDGWLLFEFHGHNPVASALLGLGATTRRSFTFLPVNGDPVALVHSVDTSCWSEWPWGMRTYASWRGMENGLTELLRGRDRIAMEVSPRSAVPTLDLVPSGIVELVRESGVHPVGSGDLVTAFHATWDAEQLDGHRRAARVVSEVAAQAFRRAADAAAAGEPTTEGSLSRWILGALERGGVEVDADCIVAVGPRAADPHYAPGERGEVVDAGSLLLVDLWGRTSKEGVAADQTWMGYLGPELPEDVAEVWCAVRDARDAVVEFLRARYEAGGDVRGFEADDVARGVIRRRGYGDFFLHRTGHSIDVELHGSGPNLDNLETRDERRLVPGVGFSVEPGIYLPGRMGIRSEINVFWGVEGPEVTPAEPQDEVFLLLDS